MSAVMEGALADLGSWKPVHCSLAKALEVVGTRSALLILRECYYGTTRFGGFAQRVGITERAAATQLRQLTEAGILTKRPYRDEGNRTREEYVLTEMGRDLLPAILGLIQWGDKYLHNGPPPVLHVEHNTGAAIRVELRSETGTPVALEEIGVRRNPRWQPTSPTRTPRAPR